MLYTPVPWESIFPADTTEAPWSELLIDGRLCLVKRSSDGHLRIERLLSTDPQDYLDSAYAPNTLVRM